MCTAAASVAAVAAAGVSHASCHQVLQSPSNRLVVPAEGKGGVSLSSHFPSLFLFLFLSLFLLSCVLSASLQFSRRLFSSFGVSSVHPA
eukprot:1322927-Rhodomonas_salina.1